MRLTRSAGVCNVLWVSVVVGVSRPHDVRCRTRGVQRRWGVRTAGRPASGDGVPRAGRYGRRAGRDRPAVVAHRPAHTCSPGSHASPHFPLTKASGGYFLCAVDASVQGTLLTVKGGQIVQLNAEALRYNPSVAGLSGGTDQGSPGQGWPRSPSNAAVEEIIEGREQEAAEQWYRSP